MKSSRSIVSPGLDSLDSEAWARYQALQQRLDHVYSPDCNDSEDLEYRCQRQRKLPRGWKQSQTDADREILSRLKEARVEQLSKLVLAGGLLNCDMPRTVREIGDRLRKQGHKISKSSLQAVCRKLADDGQLYLTRRSQLCYFRKPFPAGITGLVVVEHPGKRSERAGWIEAWRPNAQKQGLFPVVRWLDGSASYSRDEVLEPHTSGLVFDWVEMIRNGARPTPPRSLPAHLVKECDPRCTSFQTPKATALLEIGKLLGFVEEDARCFRKGQHNEVIDYLNTYYPGWRFGVNADLVRWPAAQRRA